MLTQLGRQLVSVTVAELDANSTGDVQHLNDQNCESTESHSAPTPLLHPTTKAFSLFITMIMGQKPERAPCLCTISCGDGFVAMSCVSLGAERWNGQTKTVTSKRNKQNNKSLFKRLYFHTVLDLTTPLEDPPLKLNQHMKLFG